MIYLFLAIIFFTATALFSAAASRKINPFLATLILNIFSIATPMIFLAFNKTKDFDLSARTAVLFAALAGLSVGAYGLILNKSFTVNKVGVVIPIIFGGTIILSTILSYFIFKESLKAFEIAGLALILIGIGFIIYARSLA